MSQSGLKRDLKTRLERARSRTLWLFDQVPDEFLKRRVHSFYSPIGWHFGHIGRTEEYWVISAALKQPVLNEHLTFLFADLPENPKDNRVHLPSRDEIKAYLEATRQHVMMALDEVNLQTESPLISGGFGWEFALQHECQHQETIAEMLALIHLAVEREEPAVPSESLGWNSSVSNAWIDVPAGAFCMGSDNRWGYDNEKDSHLVEIDAFGVAKHPVTAHEWSEFIADGGYRKPILWSSKGWEWRCSQAVEAPEYWLDSSGRYTLIGPTGIRPIHPDEAVNSVSWFEAQAFAEWAGARLLTEAEWEYVAKCDPGRKGSRLFPWGDSLPDASRSVNYLRAWEPGPVEAHPDGASAFGVEDLAGGVWEWTSTAFRPYPGFKAFPYDGYSKDHMLGEHMVCRGGSFATADPILRCTFRNWYVPSYRQGFLGLRLARDA